MRIVDKEIAKLAPSVGRIVPDGRAVELIRERTGGLKFLVWDRGSTKVVDQFTHDDIAYTTSLVHSSISNSIALPTAAAEFGSARQLFTEIVALISSACGGNQRVAEPLSFAVFASWLPEHAPVAPFLWVVTPPTCSTTSLKQTLGLLCRRALLVSGLSNRWPKVLPMALQPTVIAEVDGPNRGLLSTLRASQTHGIFPTGTGEGIDLFCPKLIFAREPLANPADAGFPLEIFLDPSAQYVPLLDSGRAARIADEFQNKLLGYRFSNFSNIAPPSFDLRQLSAPIQALAHSLAGAIVGDDNLQVRILPYLSELDAEIRADPASTLDAVIIEAILTHLSDQEVGVAEIAGDANTIIAGRGNTAELTPEKLGWILRRLGFHTTSMASGLRGLKMAEDRDRILMLAARYGRSLPEQPAARAAKSGMPRPGQGNGHR